jgi:hypothetical protein
VGLHPGKAVSIIDRSSVFKRFDPMLDQLK